MSKFCIKCGAEMPEESKFCPKCGNEVGKSNSGSKKKILPFIIIGGIVVAILVLVIILVIASGGGSSESGTSENSNLNNSDNKDSDSKLNNNKNNNDNNLTCSGKTSLTAGILYVKSSDADIVNIVVDDSSNEYIEYGEYTFVYNNDTLTSIKGKETFNKSFSTALTDEQIKEANEEGTIKVYKDSNNKVIFEYTLDKNEDLVKALSDENNLKEWLEENTNLTCN